LKVKLERTFPMPAAPDVTWGVLSDVAGVASCMPGAKITEKIDDTHYKGTVAVKLGPASLSFRGEIEVRALEAATRTLHLVAKGTDTTGSSFASMDLTARVEARDDGTSALAGSSEAAVGGKAAAFGGRMMDAVSDQILKQFAANFAARVAALAQPAPAAAETQPVAAAGGAATMSEAPPAPGAATVAAAAPATAASASVAPAAPSAELNGFALLWAIFRDWLRGLFSKKAS
jgi:carbon monoxide dehydrogenase subunit G